MSRIVTLAARNVRPGDTLVLSPRDPKVFGSGDERPVLSVERVDLEDRILVCIETRDNRTWGKVSSKSSYRLTDELQVRKGEGERTKMDWTPKKSL